MRSHSYSYYSSQIVGCIPSNFQFFLSQVIFTLDQQLGPCVRLGFPVQVLEAPLQHGVMPGPKPWLIIDAGCCAKKKTGITRYSFPSTNRKLGPKAWVALWLKATADLGTVKVCGFRYSWVNVCKIPATTLNVAHCPFGFLKATIVCWSWTCMGRSGLLWGGGCDKGSCIGRIVLFVCELQRHANEVNIERHKASSV